MNHRFFVVLASVLLLIRALPAQVKTSGYASLDFLKGQSQSPFSQGTFDHLDAGLILSGKKGNAFEFTLEARFRSEQKLEVEEAWLGYVPSAAFQLKAGVFLVPFGKYNRANRPYQTALASIPLPLEQFYPLSWRETGICVEGRTGFLEYVAYLGNGLREAEELSAGQQFVDNNSDKGKGGRVGLHLSRALELGFSYYRGKQDEANERNITLEGFDLTWITSNFYFLSEYIKAAIQNPAAFSPGRAEGYFGVLTLSIWNLNPFVSYQRSKYKDPFHGQGFKSPALEGDGISSEGSRWVFGLTFDFTADVLVKVEYDWNRGDGQKLKDNVFRAQVSWWF